MGLDEGVAHLLLRAQNAMLASCSVGGCGHWVLPVVIAGWAVSSIATVWWLRVVFRRYETTVALPVEYGAAALADVVTGMVFYKVGVGLTIVVKPSCE